MGFWDKWHQLNHMQTIRTSLQTDNHIDITQFLQARCFSWHPTNSDKAPKDFAYLTKTSPQKSIQSTCWR